MDKQKSHLLKLINASGFLFQLRVQNEIKNLCKNRMNSLEILTDEFPWTDPNSGKEYFIDLILQDQSETQRMVIECKKVKSAKDAPWVFLSNKELKFQNRAKILWTYKKINQKNKYDWDDFSISPLSPESSICIVTGQRDKDKPMLERLSGFVLRATEFLSNQELGLTKKRNLGRLRLYIPVIITNSILHVCYLNIDKIDIGTGTINDAEFEEVPYIRFRKNLSTTIETIKPIDNLREFSYQQDRTIFIINSNSLNIFFQELEIRNFGISQPWE